MTRSTETSLRAAAADALLTTADLVRVLALRMSGAGSDYVPIRWPDARRRSRAGASGKIHVLDIPGQGRLPPVLLLHGISASGADFGPLFRRLRPWTRRILAPDLPGHGLSSVPPQHAFSADIFDAVCDAVDAVLDGPALVVGNSLGGTVALRYALRRPQSTAGLVLVSPAGAPCTSSELESLFDVLRVSDLERARAFMRKVLPSAPWTLELMARGARVRLSRPAVRRLIEEASPSDLLTSDELEALRVPVMLVWGQQEKLFPASHHAFFRQYLPAHARIETPAAFGHAPFLDRPAQVAALLHDFCSELGSRASMLPKSSAPLAAVG
jgi:pimeloyl-ACP methyl ester carboxylesterase